VVLKRLLLTVMIAGLALMLQPRCGGGDKTPVAAKPDTAVQTGAIRDTTLDTTAAASVAVASDTQQPEPAKKVEPEPQKPKPEPEKVADKPSELPKMWDFGSEKCIPCKTMLEILTPMMTDYKGKVDIRIIDVYEEAELAKQFRIVTIPTQVFLDAEGKELLRHIGVYPRDSIEACFQKFGFPVVTGAVSPSQPPAFGST
jgi:thiol-disulfide isomerase/thioredoxin